MSRWGPIAVASLGGTLLLILASEIQHAAIWSHQASPIVEAARGTDAQEIGSDKPDLPTSADTTAILARPLFNWNRRPGQSSGVADGPLPRLSGILVSTRERYAIFAGQSGGKPQVVHEGNTIGRFTIQQITSDHIVLRNGADLQILHTSGDVPPPPPMATPDAS
jgi:hypothetical protein